MVGYPKRYDPRSLRFSRGGGGALRASAAASHDDESPFQPYISHYALQPPGGDVDESVLAELRAEAHARLVTAIGTEDEFLVGQYQNVLLDTLVHEINTTQRPSGRAGPP